MIHGRKSIAGQRENLDSHGCSASPELSVFCVFCYRPRSWRVKINIVDVSSGMAPLAGATDCVVLAFLT